MSDTDLLYFVINSKFLVLLVFFFHVNGEERKLIHRKRTAEAWTTRYNQTNLKKAYRPWRMILDLHAYDIRTVWSISNRPTYCVCGSLFYLILFFFLNDIFIRICGELSVSSHHVLKIYQVYSNQQPNFIKQSLFFLSNWSPISVTYENISHKYLNYSYFLESIQFNFNNEFVIVNKLLSCS